MTQNVTDQRATVRDVALDKIVGAYVAEANRREMPRDDRLVVGDDIEVRSLRYEGFFGDYSTVVLLVFRDDPECSWGFSVVLNENGGFYNSHVSTVSELSEREHEDPDFIVEACRQVLEDRLRAANPESTTYNKLRRLSEQENIFDGELLEAISPCGKGRTLVRFLDAYGEIRFQIVKCPTDPESVGRVVSPRAATNMVLPFGEMPVLAAWRSLRTGEYLEDMVDSRVWPVHKVHPATTARQ